MMIHILLIIYFIVIETVALILVREFIISKGNRELQTLMIIYFSVEVWVYMLLFFYFINDINFNAYLILALTPKAFIKLLIFFYLRKINKKPKHDT